MHSVPRLPILWLHGAVDEEVPLRYAQDAVSFLQSSLSVPDENVHFKVFPSLTHTTNEEEVDHLGFWLQKILI